MQDLKNIPNYPEYKAKKDGTIWKLDLSSNKLQQVNEFYDYKGRPKVSLFVNGKQKHRFVHCLILETFVGPRPKGMETCHWDGDNNNNKLENLRWDTSKNNHQDRIRHGHTNKGIKHPNCKLTEQDVKQIRKLYQLTKNDNHKSRKYTYQHLADMFNVSKATIGEIITSKIWTHI